MPSLTAAKHSTLHPLKSPNHQPFQNGPVTNCRRTRASRFGGLTLVAIGFLTLLGTASTLHAQINYEPYTITTIAGFAGASGSADGTGSAARFYFPYGIAVDHVGNAYVADTIIARFAKLLRRAMSALWLVSPVRRVAKMEV